MDTLKAKVAQTVQTAVQNTNWWIALGLDQDQDQPEVTANTDLVTGIRVRTPNRGPRYFLVTVREQY